DEAGRLTPPGIVGEVYIGGAGTARGYLHRPDLTAASFVPNPFSTTAGERLYDTGDLARYTDDGRVELLGRADYQVKIRGFRIEAGEIEAALRDMSAVRDAVVLARQDRPGDKQLVAYMVLEEGQEKPPPERLREQLLQRLPDYMIPSAWVDLPALPLTPNGKIDRRALPAPETPTGRSEAVAPRDAVEEALADIWQDVFARDQVGIHDNFFDLGGHSLMATHIHTKIRQFFQVDVRLRDLFQALTIAELAAFIKQREVRLGRSETVARAYLRMQRMSPKEREALLRKRRSS
ncbi:MAG: AMP-binding protein, partial [Candidatus Tectomicrobia bacterium]|nr:AMP-binding protein [Candidatus Tectomicrobia bacterium]